MSQIMASTLELEEITNLLLSQLNHQMKINQGKIIFIKQSKIIWQKTVGAIKGNDDQTDLKDILCLQKQALEHSSNNILVFEEIVEQNIKDIMRRIRIKIFTPLIVKKEIIGAIMFSENLQARYILMKIFMSLKYWRRR